MLTMTRSTTTISSTSNMIRFNHRRGSSASFSAFFFFFFLWTSAVMIGNVVRVNGFVLPATFRPAHPAVCHQVTTWKTTEKENFSSWEDNDDDDDSTVARRSSSNNKRNIKNKNVEKDTENNNKKDDLNIDFLFEEEEVVDEEQHEQEVPEIPFKDLSVQEQVWRYAKKPLLRIGSKGATHAHGNSLRQLLEDHTVVKVKVNTKKFGSLEKAFVTIRDLAIENGAPKDIEMIQMREMDKTILFGMPGTLKKMERGTFPPHLSA